MSDFSKIPNLTLGTDPSPYRKRIAELELQLAEAKKDADALRTELATAKADTERLDWMEAITHARGSITLQSCAYPDNPSYCWIEIDDEWNLDTLRQAIDNAMKGADE